MLSVYRYGKKVLLKNLATDSAALLLFLHRGGLISNPNLFECHRNMFFINFSSMVDVGSRASPKKKPRFTKKLARESSFEISYLINSCGLSPENALSVAEKVHFETSERPNAVIALLKEYGFSSTHISKLVKKMPNVLLTNPEKILLPKLEFFQSIGFTKDYLGRSISRGPTVLLRSLENHIIPSYNYLKSVLLTDDKVVACVKRSSWIFLHVLSKNLVPNITFLEELDVPQSCIILLLTHFPETLLQRRDVFRACVSRVVDIGFRPLNTLFVLAIHAISCKNIWARCYDSYSKLGWSKDDIYMAFKKHPNCMIMSEKKITKTMDFLVNKMGWNSKTIASCPAVLFFSLENRIVPRCYTVQFLISRQLIKKDTKLTSMLYPAEKCFLKNFVTKYEKQAPKLYDFYRGKISIEEL